MYRQSGRRATRKITSRVKWFHKWEGRNLRDSAGLSRMVD